MNNDNFFEQEKGKVNIIAVLEDKKLQDDEEIKNALGFTTGEEKWKRLVKRIKELFPNEIFKFYNYNLA